MLAKATACEANIAFLYQPATEFVEKFAGVGAKRIRHLFQLAKREQNGCIIFIDEIEAIGMVRSDSFANHEQATALNQLLTEMDGFHQNNIIVIGATNRPQLLDPALMRMGRFDRKFYVGDLSLQERIDLAKMQSEGYQIDENQLYQMCQALEGFSGAEICAVFNESKIKCAQDQNKKLNLEYGVYQVLKYRKIDEGSQLLQGLI